MPRRRVLSGKEVRKILEEHGFVLVRQVGSHMILRRKSQNGTLSLPVPNHRELSKSTLSDIINQSGLPRELFQEKS